MVKFYPSQIGSIRITPLSYTTSPFKLFFDDLWLVLINLGYLLNVFRPWTPALSGDLCELSFTLKNCRDLGLHVFLFFLQLCFLLSILIWVLMPVWAVAVGFTMFWMFNYLICSILNGPRSARTYKSAHEYAQERAKHAKERWLYLNGVCTGRHWLEGSVNRLALTFGRPVMGIHNRTNGLIFDLIECVIQRSFDYATTDIRIAYRILKDELYDDDVDRVILICHSQGGIEASIMIDRLLAEIPQDLVRKLEVYTFGNAANHFNNPHLRREYQGRALANPALPAADLNKPADPLTNQERNGKSISHIEHYAHTYEIVSRIGILHFANNHNNDALAPRFMGRIFEVKARGHMFVQHYLDTMFPLTRRRRRKLPEISQGSGKGPDDDTQPGSVVVDAEFMKSVVEREGRVAPEDSLGREDWEVSITDLEGIENGLVGGMTRVQVRNLSRLRLYLNGRIPEDRE
ncbi:f2bb4969-fd20-4266-9d11-c98415a445f8 [Sclerotinia trifoliorum]|uniref:F2bb4969-fd20-4266-9d11-c98415a445f8 n=1 Tax=Sclerotinia trifoliorum TaxID=28548 RepID=A0A8H2W5P4_9HELO|nr:f2bb4969-fd20-4266-9d11-c98415a445f8 [Sclerotinia trifoliorum]